MCLVVMVAGFLWAGLLAQAAGLPQHAPGPSGAQRRCLAGRLGGRDGGSAGLQPGPHDAFAVMDVHSGRILWAGNPAVLSRRGFQPGSVFKLVTAYAAMQHRRVDPAAIYNCRGETSAEGPAGHRVECWLRAGHGQVNLAKALAYSCNLYFAALGQNMSPAEVLQAARELGLGRSTDSDLPGEIAGSLPLQADRSDAARLAVGQGAGVRVTGLQLLAMIAAVANGGVLLSPRRSDPGGPALPPRAVLEGERSLRFLRDALQQASAYGTGAAHRLASLGLAGKTGTAAFRDAPWRTHGWYVGFWPARRPQLALVAFVYEGTGSEQAAALARAVVERVERARAACGEDGR